jgi:hypothetical protein
MGARGNVEAKRGLRGAVFVDTGLIGEGQFVAALVVLEEIENPVLLHEARDEIEGGLAVLHDILALHVGGLGFVLKIVKAEVVEDLLQNVGNGFLLEDFTVGGACEKPGPGNDFSTVVAEALVAADEGKAADKTVPVALAVVRHTHADGDALADDVLRDDGVIFGEQVRAEMEKAGHGFAAAETLEEQNVLAEGRVDADEAIVLRIGHI